MAMIVLTSFLVLSAFFMVIAELPAIRKEIASWRIWQYLYRREYIEYFTETLQGPLSFTSRKRNILILVLSSAFFMSTFIMLVEQYMILQHNKFMIYRYIYSVVFALLLLVCLLLRRRLILQNRAQILTLHDIAHWMINTRMDIEEDKEQFKKTYPFQELISTLCEHIQNYYKVEYPSCDIGVAIRLGIINTTAPEVRYETVGRAGLDKRRREKSVSISANEGVPKFFLSKNKNQNKAHSQREVRGVAFFNDLEKAKKEGHYISTHNTENAPFKEEILSFMVVPVVAFDSANIDNKHSAMIGLIFVTSKKKNLFHSKSVDSMRTVSDMSADFIEFILKSYI